MALTLAGALVHDGMGTPPVTKDVVIDKGRIVEINPAGQTKATGTLIDVTGLAVSPGFIDTHSHADNAPLLTVDDTSKILQGITTEVVGNCGASMAPRPGHSAAEQAGRFPGAWTGTGYAEFLALTDAAGYVTNYAPLVGHGSIRSTVMGSMVDPPSQDQLMAMRNELARAIEAGAFGMSLGLVYAPGVFSTTEELIDLARVLPHGAVLSAHVRGESNGVRASVDELLRVGRESGAKVHLSHHKSAGRENWGSTVDTLAALRRARSAGQQVGVDAYPYTAGSTSLVAALPPAFLSGSDSVIISRLSRADAPAVLAAELARPAHDWENHVRNAGWPGILISSTKSGRYVGQRISDIADELGVDEPSALVRVLVEERLTATMVVFSFDDADVERVLADPATMIGTDGSPPGLGGKPHPRMVGTFPTFIGKYVRERGIAELHEAIRRITSLPCDWFGIPDRGRIVPGYVADLVVFNPDVIDHPGTYENPLQPPVGIDYVLQAGQIVVEAGRYVGARAGSRLRRG